MIDRVLRRLTAPTDTAALAAFRVVLGLVALVSAIRFLAYGWVTELFVAPKVMFSYFGLSWVRPLPYPGMHIAFGVLAVAGLFTALGLFYRPAIVLVFLGFSYVTLIDITNYLNHYYLLALLAGLCATMPLGGAHSLDARLFPAARRASFPAWCTYLLRFQVGAVYTFAGVAKISSDWLLHAQPLSLWLSARTGLPVIGPLFTLPGAFHVMAWAGCLFDLTIAFWLSWRKARPWAYGVVLFFHAVTRALFPIGMFPVIMVAAALVFFEPDWPRRAWAGARRALGRGPRHPSSEVAPGARISAPRPPETRALAARLALAAGLLFVAAQIVWPLRTFLYGGDVHWHEQGMRFSWRVMVREKNASVTYRVRDEATRKVTEVNPRRYLTPRQERDFGTQPDMILFLAHHLCREQGASRGRDVAVFADVLVSLNGRRSARLIDPEVDLCRARDGLAPATWILPAPDESPARITAVAAR